MISDISTISNLHQMLQFYVFWGKYSLQVKWMSMIVLILRLYDFKRLAAYWWKVSICLKWMFKVFLITAKNKETHFKKKVFFKLSMDEKITHLENRQSQCCAFFSWFWSMSTTPPFSLEICLPYCRYHFHTDYLQYY